MAQTLTAPVTADQLAELAERMENEDVVVRIWADTARGPAMGTIDYINLSIGQIEFTLTGMDRSEYIGIAQIQELEVLS